LYDYAS
jgi:hypothetical protein